MNRVLLSIAGLSVACALTVPGGAEAQSSRRHVVRAFETAPPLTVNRRSWLDSGNVVAVGTQSSYLAASTSLNTQVYSSVLADRFGQSTLPGRFDLPLPGNPRGPESGGIFFDD